MKAHLRPGGTRYYSEKPCNGPFFYPSISHASME